MRPADKAADGAVLGRGIRQGSTTVDELTHAMIVLKKDPSSGHFILTGYPDH